MKLYRRSIAFRLAYDILRFGNLPYSALKLYPYSYESVKDAAQKLLRASYLGVVKARNIRSLYVTPLGYSAVTEALERHRDKKVERYPIVYDPLKVARVDKLNEAILLFMQAGYKINGEYTDSREIKRILETTQRAGDNLKYSRFAGLWRTQEFGMLVYHFGRNNIDLNENGEFNARFKALEMLGRNPYEMRNIPMLILGSSMDTLLKILRYSEWLARMPKSRRKGLKNVHYHLDIEQDISYNTYFLPIDRCSIPILKMMCSEEWEDGMQYIHNFYRQQSGMEIVGALDCRLKALLWNHTWYNLADSEELLIVCYDWQRDMIEEYCHDIADCKEIWLQTLDTPTVEGTFWGHQDNLPYNPRRLTVYRTRSRS